MTTLARGRMAAGLGIAALMLMTATPAPGQQPGPAREKMMFEEQDTMSAVLSRLEGKSVRIRLVGSNDEIIGKLEKVGKDLAHLSNLSGREFFDAVVRIDQVAAVSAQVRGR